MKIEKVILRNQYNIMKALAELMLGSRTKEQLTNSMQETAKMLNDIDEQVKK